MAFITEPKWIRELKLFRSINPAFIIEGNIYDLYPMIPAATAGQVDMAQEQPASVSATQAISRVGIRFIELDAFLYDLLTENNTEIVLFYDPINGFYNRFTGSAIEKHLKDFSDGGHMPVSKPDNYLQTKYEVKDTQVAAAIVRNALTNTSVSVAVILLFASQFIADPSNLECDERHTFMNLLYASINATQVYDHSTGMKGRNQLYIIADKINDLPTWLYMNNSYIKNVVIPPPERDVRVRYIEYCTGGLYEQLRNESDIQKYRELFADLTEGMRCVELRALVNLCEQEKLGLCDVRQAVSLYKYGIKENRWVEVTSAKLKNAESSIKKRVKGQQNAVTKTLNVIKRAVSGMSGLQHSGSSSKPKGILFFAGPTGVGKTELAKAVAELLFGDESNCIRFDMSEYQQSHSDQRLLGSPPGYVGFEAGGQLTNAVKQKPFSILLFDEIEKAHPSILDKFLQILEDGRMTDGMGNTIYFSECLIIFTSNLGIYADNGLGVKEKKVSPDMPYEELQATVVEGIKDYFNLQLGRPELLNRIGNNIVVFKFIGTDAAREILEMQMSQVNNAVLEARKITVNPSADFFAALMSKAVANIDNGGRGIGNVVETMYITPLSSYIFDNDVPDGSILEVNSLLLDGDIASIECEVKMNA